MIIKMSVTLAKAFATWKEMIHNNVDTVKEHGFKMIFAGTETGDDSKLHVIMELDSLSLGLVTSFAEKIIEINQSQSGKSQNHY